MIVHILPETEPFSEYHGGALSRWAANVLQGDTQSLIIAPSTDSSWSFPSEGVRCLPGLSRYRQIRQVFRYRLPKSLERKWLKALFTSSLSLKAGDTVWIHNRPEFAIALSSVVRSANARLVLHLQNSHLKTFSTKLIRLAHIDKLVFCSEYLRKESLEVHPGVSGSIVIYNGASQELFYPPPDGRSQRNKPPIILYVGRLVPEKGVHVFLAAIRLLTERRVDVRGLVVGAPAFGQNEMTPYVQQLKTTAPPNVHFHQYCSGRPLADKFGEADIFCCPSMWDEPFGLVNVEAMASGLPVVATDTGGIPEIFSDGGAILVKRGSAVSLADALERLALDPARRWRVGQQGYSSFLKRFTWTTIRDNYEEAVRSME